MKKELLDYIDRLINNFEMQQANIMEENLGNLIYFQKKIDRVVSDVEYISQINLETLDEYINVPYDALNTIALYQQLSVSKNYPLAVSQKDYIIYLFQEFKKNLENKVKNFKEGSLEYQNLSNQIDNLNNIRLILISKVNITLDDYILIVQIIKKIKENYNSELLENVSSYMRNIMVSQNQIPDDKIRRSK